MLDRRTLLGASAASPLIWTGAFGSAFAATPKDTIVMAGQIDDMISLDPGESFEFTGNEVCGNLYERLISPEVADPTNIRPRLAESWSTSPDGLVTTFKIAQGRKFASGNPLTAEDVAYSIVRAVAMNKAPAFILNQFGFSKENAAETVRTPDPHTLVLTIKEAQSPTFLLYCLSANVGGVVDKKLVQSHEKDGDWGNAWLKQNSAGSNAWVLRSWRASEAVSLEANPHYPHPPAVKRVLFLHRPDPSAQLLQLQKGDIDIARSLAPEQIRAIEKDANFTVQSASKATITYIAMNQKKPELTHPEVRQAIKWAIDYKTIATNITPIINKVQQAFLPQGFPAALADTPFQKDVDKARGLLKQAGLEGGFELTLDHQSTAPYADIAQAVQADLAQIGIRVKLLPGENRQVITKTRARQHELAMVTWGSDYMDPNSNAETFCVNTDNGDDARNRTLAWRSSWQDKEMTDRAIAALHEKDAARRVQAYEALQRDHRERSPFALMLQQVSVAVSRKGVSGLEMGPLSDSTTYAGLRRA